MGKEGKNAPIGVFDSGVGGLTVVREIMRQIPNEKIIYFGDTARVPYGSKSKETITRYSRQIVRFLESQDVKAIVIACNTASAYALSELEKEVNIPIIGVVKPGAKVAAEATKNGKRNQKGCQGYRKSVSFVCSACGRGALGRPGYGRNCKKIPDGIYPAG